MKDERRTKEGRKKDKIEEIRTQTSGQTHLPHTINPTGLLTCTMMCPTERTTSVRVPVSHPSKTWLNMAINILNPARTHSIPLLSRPANMSNATDTTSCMADGKWCCNAKERLATRTVVTKTGHSASNCSSSAMAGRMDCTKREESS